MFEFGEYLLDRVQIRAVGRQKDQVGSCRSYAGSDCFSLVAAEIVEDHQVAWLEDSEEELFDLALKAFADDGAVEHARRGDRIATQGGEKSHGLPMAVRHMLNQPFALSAPAAQRRHVGLHPGLIDEHQPLDVDARLILAPPGAPLGNVRPLLLGGANAFF